MNKQEALTILITHSDLVTPEVKARLLAHIPSLSDQDLTDLGTLFAVEQQQSKENTKKDIAAIDDLVAKIDAARQDN